MQLAIVASREHLHAAVPCQVGGDRPFRGPPGASAITRPRHHVRPPSPVYQQLEEVVVVIGPENRLEFGCIARRKDRRGGSGGFLFFGGEHENDFIEKSPPVFVRPKPRPCGSLKDGGAPADRREGFK